MRVGWGGGGKFLSTEGCGGEGTEWRSRGGNQDREGLWQIRESLRDRVSLASLLWL